MRVIRIIASSCWAALALTVVRPAHSQQGDQDIRAVASAEREHYVLNFRLAYSDWCTKKQQVCVAELLIRPNGMNVPAPYDQIRLDFVSNLNGKFESRRYEHPKPFQTFAPRTIRLDSGMSVELAPIAWNRVEFRSAVPPRSLDLLTEWANKWLDITDTKPVPKGELLGVVHSITYPTAKFGAWRTEVDFGTSDYLAFAELLAVLERMGVKKVSVGSAP